MRVAREQKREYPSLAPFDHHLRAQGEKSRWHEADVPWDDLDEEGMSEPEPSFDNGADDDDDDEDDDGDDD
jgi:hypothetical protein